MHFTIALTINIILAEVSVIAQELKHCARCCFGYLEKSDLVLCNISIIVITIKIINVIVWLGLYSAVDECTRHQPEAHETQTQTKPTE